MKLVWLALVMVAAVKLTLAQPVGPLVQLCGRHLANARHYFCSANGDYDTPSQKTSKRSALLEAFSFEKVEGTPQRPQQAPETSTVALKTATGALESFTIAPDTRTKRGLGIADECCLKPCFVADLLHYC